MSERCPTCHLLVRQAEQPWALGVHCPRTHSLNTLNEVHAPMLAVLANRDCLQVGFDRVSEDNAQLKAKLDRSRLLHLKSVAAMDAVIAEERIQPESRGTDEGEDRLG